MIITDLLGARVFGPEFVGFVSDVRFSFDTSSIGQSAQLYGIIVSPHARSSSLGFERSGVRSPWPIAGEPYESCAMRPAAAGPAITTMIPMAIKMAAIFLIPLSC